MLITNLHYLINVLQHNITDSPYANNCYLSHQRLVADYHAQRVHTKCWADHLGCCD